MECTCEEPLHPIRLPRAARQKLFEVLDFTVKENSYKEMDGEVDVMVYKDCMMKKYDGDDEVF